jgi:hypothetical protein
LELVGVQEGLSVTLVRSWTKVYFVNRCLTGFAAVGSAAKSRMLAEIANVSHVLQPGAQLTASKSLIGSQAQETLHVPKERAYPICGPMPTTRDLDPPRVGLTRVVGDLPIGISGEAYNNLL